jgi:hypothetical protein
MGMIWLHRAVYRVRQFGSALATRGRPLTEAERTEVRAWLPATAWPLFDAMPHNDQHHSLNVLHSLRAADHGEPALMQAALLHDVAKSTGGVTLFHRIAIVLIKVARPDWAARLTQTPAPDRANLRYPFWALANHPQQGAEMAAAAGCDPLVVTLIRRHQEAGRAEDPLWGSGGDPSGGRRIRRDGENCEAPLAESPELMHDQALADRLLAALHVADDDN